MQRTGTTQSRRPAVGRLICMAMAAGSIMMAASAAVPSIAAAAARAPRLQPPPPLPAGGCGGTCKCPPTAVSSCTVPETEQQAEAEAATAEQQAEAQAPDATQYPTAEPSAPDTGDTDVADGYSTDDASPDSTEFAAVSPSAAAQVAAGTLSFAQAAATPGAVGCHGTWVHKRNVTSHNLRWAYKVTCTGSPVLFDEFTAELATPKGTVQQDGNDASGTYGFSATSYLPRKK